MGCVILDHDDLAAQVRGDREAGRRIVFANGCFDVIHVGHVRYLKGAAACGDVLIVALNTDASVRSNKGDGRPFVPQAERAEILSAIECVDYVTLFADPTVDPLLRLLKPDIHAKGTDWTAETVPERETVLAYGGEIRIVGDPKDRSSSDLIERMRER